MADTKEFFLNITQRLFSNWTALRMAVEHGMGSKDRAVDFCPYITDIIYMNDDLSSDDLAAELEEYMDREFQTELQDNSAKEIAEILMNFYHYSHDGYGETVMTEMNKLPQLQPWILSRDQIKQLTSKSLPINDDSSSDSEEENGNSMETTATNVSEWVEVKTRRKK
ncbi:hypothetical protein PV327_008479 [Microctonus hyperodae]|uniref:Pre-rRNA-processing protein TSR2 homolog n=1 Tax=Microctonus hyperodae TaxID=165561 RepID=A0AA39KHA6_MICHY|nr:hypothetical protein PV327_008479 [Microctonus hyperodae]